MAYIEKIITALSIYLLGMCGVTDLLLRFNCETLLACCLWCPGVPGRFVRAVLIYAATCLASSAVGCTLLRRVFCAVSRVSVRLVASRRHSALITHPSTELPASHTARETRVLEREKHIHTRNPGTSAPVA